MVAIRRNLGLKLPVQLIFGVLFLTIIFLKPKFLIIGLNAKRPLVFLYSSSLSFYVCLLIFLLFLLLRVILLFSNKPFRIL